MDNRLQFRHHSEIFNSRDEAIEYIYSQIRFADDGLASEDKSYGFSLLGEPTVLRYKNESDANLPSGSTPNPHVIIAIGSNTNEGTQYNDNRFCIIDMDKTEQEISDIWDDLEKAIRSLTVITRDSNTLKLYSDKTSAGTVVSGDVVVASSHIFNDIRKPNILMDTDGGLFTYVSMDYDPETDILTFSVNGDTKVLPVNNNYLVRGYYSKKDESLHLIRKDDVDIKISLENLIDEWGVEGDGSSTPIVLTREKIGYGDDALHNHVEPWQDLLKGDIRLADRRYNIIKKTSDGRYLYVDGLASNITFFKDGEEMSVQEALASATKGISNDSTNIIYEKADGIFSTAMLRYVNNENKLIFTTSNVTGGTTVEEIKLNAVEAFTKIYYDKVTENLVILYKDGSGDIQEVDIPIGEMMQDWEWDIVNEGHNVKLHKQRVVNGNDKVSADVALYEDPDNILVDKNHELFVKGTSDNIRYGRDGNVESELDKLNANYEDMDSRLGETSGKVDTLRNEFDAEVARATGEERRIDGKLSDEIARSVEKDREHDSRIGDIEETIGTGFTTDGHETVTYKFNELLSKTNTVSAKTDTNTANIGLISAKTEAEVVRAKGEEQRIEKKFDDELGEGFNIRNTVRDEFDKEKGERERADSLMQSEIDAVSADTLGKISDIINIDHSIGIDKTDRIRPVVKVNLSEELIDGKENIIKLNNDGLYAGVDLEYAFDDQTGANTLFFSTTNGTKRIELKTNSVVDKIYYDPTQEAIIIEYTVNGRRMPDVVVPVGDLISEWRVSESTNGAIKLSLTRVGSGETPHGKDVLYAETVIATHEDNILINDDGALYVSGRQIEINKEDIADLKVRMDVAENDIDELERGLAAEKARAEGEEQRIEERLDREIDRSVAEDDEIWRALRAEISRSTEKDEEHDRRITDEVNRAKDAERNLHDEIVNEERRALSAETDLSNRIDAEVTRATNAETDLSNRIDAEVTRATNAEAALDTKIENEITRSTQKDNEHDAKIIELHESIVNEINRASSAETDLNNRLTAEVTRATNAETDLSNRIDAEVTRATNAETDLSNRIDAEVTRATDAENVLNTKIENEITRSTSEDLRLDRAIHDEYDRALSAETDIRHAIELEETLRISGDSILDSKIEREKSERISADTRLDEKIVQETADRIGADAILRADIDAEVARSRQKDDEHDAAIAQEIRDREAGDNALDIKIISEKARAEGREGEIENELNLEVQRALGAESALTLLISAEKEARMEEDADIWEHIRPIEFHDTTTIHYERFRNSGKTPDDVSSSVIISTSDKNIVKATDNLGGVFATVTLDYDEITNTLTLNGTDGIVLSSLQLGPGGILDNIYYDHTEKDLVIEYTTASGEHKVEKFPVAQLFNEWDVQNPTEGSAIELHKIPNTTETGTVDLLWGRVLLTSAVERPDGTIDYGDNIIRIVNNGLYVSGTPIIEARQIADCAKNELTVVEEAVLGKHFDEYYQCGSGFTYSPFEDACFISAATSMNDADEILDRYVCSAHTRITKVEQDLECLLQEVNITQENVIFGQDITVPPCGISSDGTPFTYPQNHRACIISAATSMYHADELLDEAICGIIGDVNCYGLEVRKVEEVLGVEGNCDNPIAYPTTHGCLLSAATTFAEADALMEAEICRLMGKGIEGSERPTSSTKIENEDEDTSRVVVDVRLSYGNSIPEWDTNDYVIDSIETTNEFTETNVLNVVDVTQLGFDPESKFNGLYLSNVWDCGEYTENGDARGRYKYDNSATAQNYYFRKYRNFVRKNNA